MDSPGSLLSRGSRVESTIPGLGDVWKTWVPILTLLLVVWLWASPFPSYVQHQRKVKGARDSVAGLVLSILPMLLHTLFPTVQWGEQVSPYFVVEKTEAG